MDTENHFGDVVTGHRQQRDPLHRLTGAAAERAARRWGLYGDILRAHIVRPLRPAMSIPPGTDGIAP